MASLPFELPNLEEELARLLAQIPVGRVSTYGSLAVALGAKVAARWVGTWMLDHPHSGDCPCHRVVRSNGELGLFITRTDREKARRLRSEGIDIERNRVDLDSFQFNDFRSDFPLEKLIKFQNQLPSRVRTTPLTTIPRQIGGIDVSYNSEREAVAAYVLYDRVEQAIVYSKTWRRRACFPYIPGFLTFRELPVYLDALEEIRNDGQLAKVILVDGNGRLHPRRAGIAAALGVVGKCRTIGVAKKLLCGHVATETHSANDAFPVIHSDETIGAELKATPTSKTNYVSVGHRIDLQSGIEIVRATFEGHRLPEPIYHADRISRNEARR